MYMMTLKSISLDVYLGVYANEQLTAKNIDVDISLRFLEMPGGCISDKIADVICYEMINNVLKTTVKKKRYHLIEHLTLELIRAVNQILTVPADIYLSVHKNPPLNNIKISTFTIEMKWQK